MRNMSGQSFNERRGFTLIELLLVTVIIAILVSIALPNLLRSKMSANEASAVGSTRTIATSEIGFQAATFVDANSDGQGDFGTLAELHDPDGAGSTEPYIDSVLANGVKHGYNFTVAITYGTTTQKPEFTLTTVPQTPGSRQFFVDESGVIRCTADGSVVGPGSNPLG